jgi:hypothetical protein
MDDADQFLCGLCGSSPIWLVHDTDSNVVLDDFRDEAVQRASARGCLLKYGRAPSLGLQCPPHRFHLSADTVQAVQQFRFFLIQVDMSS